MDIADKFTPKWSRLALENSILEATRATTISNRIAWMHTAAHQIRMFDEFLCKFKTHI